MFNKTRGLAAIAVAAVLSIAMVGCSNSAASPPTSTYNPQEKVTLNFAFWGNDVRSSYYKQAFALFEKKYPNITINSSVTDFPSFWQKRQIEAAGGNLPDVMQFDYSYLRQFARNGFLLDLDPYLGNVIQTGAIPASVLKTGVVDNKTIALTVGTNAWANFSNVPLTSSLGLDQLKGGTSFSSFDSWLATASKAGKGSHFGGQDYSNFIQGFELKLRSEGKHLFDENGKPGFTKSDLTDFWQHGLDLTKSGAVVPQQRVQEVFPKGPLGAGIDVSEMSYDNFGAAFAGDLGVDASTLRLLAPPVYVEGAKDLYLKPAMLHAVAATTKHPGAAALLVNFLINDPQVGAIFGTSRGLPASKTELAGVKLTGPDKAVKDYEASITDRLGDPPPAPIVGYGVLEQKFKELGADVDLGSTAVAEAVNQFFDEIATVANS